MLPYFINELFFAEQHMSGKYQVLLLSCEILLVISRAVPIKIFTAIPIANISCPISADTDS